jgi:NitT/TauT family transport system substrate-binding protein
MLSAIRNTRFTPAALALATMALFAAGPASAQTTVKFGVAAMSTSFTTSLMGGSNPEIYAKHGIRLEITDFRGNTNNCIAGVLSGAVDVCQVGSTSVTDAIQEGGNFRAVAVVTKPLGEIVLGRKQIARLGGVNEKSPLVDRVKAMKGLRITSSGQGTPHYLALDALMQVGGLTANDLKFRPLFDPVAMQESIRNDQIDGSLWTVGTLGNILADGTGVSWINMAAGEVPTVSPMPYTMVIAMNPYIEKNTPTLVRLRAAMAESVTLLAAEPAKFSVAIKGKYFPQMEQKAWDDGWKFIPTGFFPGATVPKSSWDYMLKLQAASTKKTYDKATYERALIPEAQLK